MPKYVTPAGRVDLDRTAEDDEDDPEPLVVTLTVERLEGRRIDRVSLTVDAVTTVGEAGTA